MDAAYLIDKLKRQPWFEDQVIHVREIAARDAVFEEVEGGIAAPVLEALSHKGITRFYAHQAAAIRRIRDGKDIVIVTGTASGKTLCYMVPALEALVADPHATMLFLYPTKALAQDQLRTLTSYMDNDAGLPFLAGAYDGDTPAALRRKLRDNGSVILTNPDMLHQGILPQHARWNRFFTHLAFVVIDEVHAYRGVFGSHLANVIRRLDRICRHYGSAPRFICCSATIANPAEHAGRICGRSMTCVDNDGSPRGPKRFLFWNPPVLKSAARGANDNWRIGGDRRSSLGEAVNLMAALVREGIQTIAFVRTRLSAELIYRGVRERLVSVSRTLADSVHAYRGGYLPQERREIERRLAAREILGVASTNALELGIDIGTLDACILVGYPGTIASLWQQSGRAGRGAEEAVVFLVGQNAPMDQYLMAHTSYLFDKSPEQAVIDPDNPHIIVGHVKCASSELPLTADECARLGPYAEPVLDILEEDHSVRRIDNTWYWASSDYPAAGMTLRNIAGPVYTIQDAAAGNKVIGTMDEVSALSQLHNHAVYLHGAETYFVDRLDLEQKIAFVNRQDLDYYTQSVQTSDIRVDRTDGSAQLNGGQLSFGDVTVTTHIPMFKKIKFHSRDSLGFEKLELPPQSLETVALWFAPPGACAEHLAAKGLLTGEALIGIGNVLIEVAPLYVMCDTQDIGVVVDSRNLGVDALFLHDKYPGGMGFARRCFDRFAEIIQTVREVIAGCGCPDGCPSCVGSPVPVTAMTDLDSAVRGRIPDKKAALALLEIMRI